MIESFILTAVKEISYFLPIDNTDKLREDLQKELSNFFRKTCFTRRKINCSWKCYVSELLCYESRIPSITITITESGIDEPTKIDQILPIAVASFGKRAALILRSKVRILLKDEFLLVSLQLYLNFTHICEAQLMNIPQNNRCKTYWSEP